MGPGRNPLTTPAPGAKTPGVKTPGVKTPGATAPNAKAPNFRRLIPLGLAVLLLTTALLFWARDVIREVIVLPLSYVIYYLRLFVRTTPQIFFWIGLLALLLVAAWRRVSVRPKELAAAPVHLKAGEWDGRVAGRAAFWSTKVALLRDGQVGGYYQRSFHAALGRLLLEVLAYRYRLAPNQVEEGLRDGSLAVPPEIRDYALSSLRREEISRQTAWIEWWEGTFGALWKRLINGLRAWVEATGLFVARNPAGAQSRAAAKNIAAAKSTAAAKNTAGSRKPEPPLDPRLARVIAYMKEELEVPNDDSGR